MSTNAARPLTETMEIIGNLFAQGTQLGLDLIDTMSAGSMNALDRAMSSSSMSGLMSRAKTSLSPMVDGSCRIPPPCWMPQFAGEVTSYVCPGSTAVLRLEISNCDFKGREIRVESTSKTPEVKITPDTLSLGPMEHGTVSATISIPAEESAGQEHEVLLWVRGCRDHYLRWKVQVTKRGGNCCQELEIEDCPDYVHHYYDHFYCQRPCTHSNR